MKSRHPTACISTYQWRPCALSYVWSRSSGVHVTEKVLDPSKGDTATLVAHLYRQRRILSGETDQGKEREWLRSLNTWHLLNGKSEVAYCLFTPHIVKVNHSIIASHSKTFFQNVHAHLCLHLGQQHLRVTCKYFEIKRNMTDSFLFFKITNIRSPISFVLGSAN